MFYLQKTITIIAIIFPVFSTAQNIAPTDMQHLLSNLVLVSSFIKDKKGNDVVESGGGFIIQGKYLATCYHVYQPPNIFNKPYKVLVSYNFRQNGAQIISDSMQVDLNYKYTKNQYNFSKHIYVDKQFDTDFIILRLEKNIPLSELKFNTSVNLPKYTQMPVLGFDHILNGLSYSISTYLYAEMPEKPSAYQLVTLGKSISGFSGTPLYNEGGEIIGLIQGGDDEISLDKLNAVQAAGFLEKKDIDGIKKAYKDGWSISYAINIKFLLDTYISSFLKD